jgi:mycothiol synthase
MIIGMSDSTFSIRPVVDGDDLDELHADDADWLGAALTRDLIASSGDALLLFQVAESDGSLIGYVDGILPENDNPTRAGRATVWVRPDWRRRGIGSALWRALWEAGSERGVKRFTSRVDAEDVAARAWVAAIGATTDGVHFESTLNLDGGLLSREPPEGITIETLESDASEIEWRKAYSATVRLMADTPDAATNPAPMPYEIFRTLLAGPWQVAVAKSNDGEIVGLTSVFVKNEGDRSVNTMLTAVNRDWRGKGLATALKVAHAVKLRDAGWRLIITQNMEGNDHILAANKRLGFTPSSATLDAIYDFPDP